MRCGFQAPHCSSPWPYVMMDVVAILISKGRIATLLAEHGHLTSRHHGLDGVQELTDATSIDSAPNSSLVWFAIHSVTP